jgi:uncharacterized membrane protein YhhN
MVSDRAIGSDAMLAVAVSFTAVAAGGLVWAEVNRSSALRWLKVVASTGFIWVAMSVGALDSAYGRAVLVALALSWCGDLLLTYSDRAAFVGGLVAFLVAHLVYSIAFGTLGVDPAAAASAVIVLAIVGGFIWRWLAPHVGSLRGPIVAYLVVISFMVVVAAGAYGGGATALIPIGAVLFYGSDAAVARNQFVAPGTVNRVIGLPLYYLAQVLLASTAGG